MRCLTLLLLTSVAYGAGPVSMDEVRAANDRNRDAVTTAVFKEIVLVSNPVGPQDYARQRQRIAESYDQATGQFLGARQAKSPETVDDFLNEQDAGVVERTAKIWSLTRSTAVWRTTHVDFSKGFVRCDTQDVRALDEIGARHGLDSLELLSVDRTGTVISTDEFFVSVPPPTQQALVYRGSGDTLSRCRRRLGIAPDGILDGAFRSAVGRSAGLVQIVGTTETGNFEAELRDDLNYRLSRLTKRRDGDLAFDVTFRDYQYVDGIPVPLVSITRRARHGVPEHQVEFRLLISVSLNPAIPTSTFQVPADRALIFTDPSLEHVWEAKMKTLKKP